MPSSEISFLYLYILLGLLSSCLAFPPFPTLSLARKIAIDDKRDHSSHYSKELSPTSRLQQRSTVSDLLQEYPDLSYLRPRLTNHITVTSHVPIVPNEQSPTPSNAFQAVSSFYSAIASRSAQLEQQNETMEKAMAFGANRFWINFYGSREEGIQWSDVQWLAEKCRAWVQRGFVGKWEGWVFLERGRGTVRFEVRIF